MATMTKHTRTFSVQNSTGGAITRVVASHRTNGSEWPNSTIHDENLETNGTVGGGNVVTSTSYRDHWDVSFVNGNNELRTGSWACGFGSEDNGQNVIIDLGTSAYKIRMPKSSDCSHAYDQS